MSVTGGAPLALVNIKRIWQNGHRWYALADILDQVHGEWHINVEASFDHEPTEQEAEAHFLEHGGLIEDETTQDRNPLNQTDQFKSWLFREFQPVFRELVNQILRNPGISFAQMIVNLNRAFPDSIFSMEELVLWIQERFGIPDWMAFKMWIYANQDGYLPDNWVNHG